MKGKDENDATSWDSSNISLYESLDKNSNSKKLFYIKEIVNLENYPKANDTLKKHLNNFYDTINKLKEVGYTVDEISIDKELLNAIPSVYVCLSCAEATSNLSNLTGIVFGPRGNGDNIYEMITDHRTKGFSPLIKRRLVIGSYILQKENQERYFVNAARARRLIVDKMKELFAMYNALILPVSTGPAPLLEKIGDELNEDDTALLEEHLQIGNFGGFPSITIPNGFINNLPVGINITGNCYDDVNVLNIAYKLESLMDYKDMVVRDE